MSDQAEQNGPSVQNVQDVPIAVNDVPNGVTVTNEMGEVNGVNAYDPSAGSFASVGASSAPIVVDCKDYLKETPVPSNQLFGVFSFISPKNVKNQTNDLMCGIKFCGAFASESDARAWIDKIKDVEPYIHLFIGDMGKWLPFDPDPDNRAQVGNSEYRNERLNNLMKLNVENHEKSNIDFWERKQEQVNEALKDQKTRRQKQKERARRKLIERQNIQRMAGIEVKEPQKQQPTVKPAKTGVKSANTEVQSTNTEQVVPTVTNTAIPENVTSENIDALTKEIKESRAQIEREAKEADRIKRDTQKLERIYNRLKAKQGQ